LTPAGPATPFTPFVPLCPSLPSLPAQPAAMVKINSAQIFRMIDLLLDERFHPPTSALEIDYQPVR
jgi:hypothetical protein